MNFKAYFTKRRIYRYGMIIFGILLILIILITYYGQFAGTFVIEVDEIARTRGIMLSDERDFESPSPSLLAHPISDAKDITYSWFEDSIEEAMNTDGDYFHDRYTFVAYTFYLSNLGTEICDITTSLNIATATYNVDAAIRVLLIEDNTERTLYQKKDDVLYDYSNVFPEDLETVEFLDEATIFSNSLIGIRPNQIKKFTIFVWLEGNDPDCIDDITAGRLKMNWTFTITRIYDDEAEE